MDNAHPFHFRRDGYLCGIRAAEDDTTTLLAAVNRFTLRPLTIDDIAVFTLDLCNNAVDRHHSRFPDEELERINELIVGRPLMERHDLRGSLPRGTFFRSRLHRDGAQLSVRPDVYVLRTADNADFIRNIEGGVYRETSIGFASSSTSPPAKPPPTAPPPSAANAPSSPHATPPSPSAPPAPKKPPGTSSPHT